MMSYIFGESASFTVPPSPLSLSVSDPPSVTIDGYDHNWYVGRSGVTLVCLANANPAPTTFTWTT